eukprot:g1622.t1
MTSRPSYAQRAVIISLLPVCLFLFVFLRHGNVYTQNDFSTLLTLSLGSAEAFKKSEESYEPAAWKAPPAVRDYEPLGVEFTDEPWWEQRDSNRTLYVATHCGAGNVLEVLASALTMSYKENINFKFVFVREWFGPATWDDLFSFPKLNFNYTFPDGVYSHYLTKACKVLEPLWSWKHDFKKIKWTRELNGTGEFGCVKCDWWREPPFPQNALWFYRILRPEKYLQMRIDAFKREHNWDKYQWVGVHIRRTDNIGTMKGLLNLETQKALKGKINTTNADTILPIENYIKVMDDIQRSHPVHNFGSFQLVKPLKFFLATDKDETRSKILEAFPEGQVIYYQHGIPSSQLRRKNWGMKLAVIDMFLLASCQALIATPFSTFSEAAHYIGGNLVLEPNFAYQT